MVTRGWIRVAMRKLDEAESTEWNPVPKGTSEQKLKPGEIVPVDIALYPSSTFFAAGESLAAHSGRTRDHPHAALHKERVHEPRHARASHRRGLRFLSTGSGYTKSVSRSGYCSRESNTALIKSSGTSSGTVSSAGPRLCRFRSCVCTPPGTPGIRDKIRKCHSKTFACFEGSSPSRY